VLGKELAQSLVHAVQDELSSPFHFLDAIYCVNPDRQPDRWEAMERRFRELGIARRVRRFAAADTPSNHQIGRALSHRRVISKRNNRNWETSL